MSKVSKIVIYITGLLIPFGLNVQVMADEGQNPGISEQVSSDGLVGRFQNYRVESSGVITKSDDWVLRRSPELIAYEREDISDVWERNGVGEMLYLQVYHEFNTYIEYNEADFRVLEQSEPEWEQIGALFDLNALEELEASDLYDLAGHDVTVYSGSLQGLDTTVHWVECLRLPVKIEYQFQDYSQVIELKSLYGLEDSPWPRWQKTGYFGMDFVDMGDNESHPLVRALNSGHASGHNH